MLAGDSGPVIFDHRPSRVRRRSPSTRSARTASQRMMRTRIPQLDQALAGHRVVDGAGAACRADDVAELPVEGHLLAEGESTPRSSTAKRAHGGLPAVARAPTTRSAAVRAPHEEHLVELGGSGDSVGSVAPRCQARIHRHQQVRQAVVSVDPSSVRARRSTSPTAGRRRPHLLAVDDPTRRPRRARVKTLARSEPALFGVVLAPELGSRHDAGQEPPGSVAMRSGSASDREGPRR